MKIKTSKLDVMFLQSELGLFLRDVPDPSLLWHKLDLLAKYSGYSGFLQYGNIRCWGGTVKEAAEDLESQLIE